MVTVVVGVVVAVEVVDGIDAEDVEGNVGLFLSFSGAPFGEVNDGRDGVGGEDLFDGDVISEGDIG